MEFETLFQEFEDGFALVHQNEVVLFLVEIEGGVDAHPFQFTILSGHQFGRVVPAPADEVHLTGHAAQTAEVARDGGDALEVAGMT